MPSTDVLQQETSKPKSSGALRRLAMPLLWAVLLFASAGRIDWTRGWICLAVYVVCMAVVGVLMHRLNPELEQERAKGQRPDTKRSDKIFLSIFLPLTMLQPAIAGLDAVRFRWTAIPFVAVFPGIILFVAAIALIAWSLVVNRHAETTVRIQSERVHSVVTSGPYRFVRHPMYTGMILMYPATALMLGSFWALIISGLLAMLVVWRTAMEDRTLRTELSGYEAFTATTRYRLVPGIW